MNSVLGSLLAAFPDELQAESEGDEKILSIDERDNLSFLGIRDEGRPSQLLLEELKAQLLGSVTDKAAVPPILPSCKYFSPEEIPAPQDLLQLMPSFRSWMVWKQDRKDHEDANVDVYEKVVPKHIFKLMQEVNISTFSNRAVPELPTQWSKAFLSILEKLQIPEDIDAFRSSAEVSDNHDYKCLTAPLKWNRPKEPSKTLRAHRRLKEYGRATASTDRNWVAVGKPKNFGKYIVSRQNRKAKLNWAVFQFHSRRLDILRQERMKRGKARAAPEETPLPVASALHLDT